MVLLFVEIEIYEKELKKNIVENFVDWIGCHDGFERGVTA